jgi:hypothetical protein
MLELSTPQTKRSRNIKAISECAVLSEVSEFRGFSVADVEVKMCDNGRFMRSKMGTKEVISGRIEVSTVEPETRGH